MGWSCQLVPCPAGFEFKHVFLLYLLPNKSAKSSVPYYATNSGGVRRDGGHTFSKGVCAKINEIDWNSNTVHRFSLHHLSHPWHRFRMWNLPDFSPIVWSTEGPFSLRTVEAFILCQSKSAPPMSWRFSQPQIPSSNVQNATGSQASLDNLTSSIAMSPITPFPRTPSKTICKVKKKKKKMNTSS